MIKRLAKLIKYKFIYRKKNVHFSFNCNIDAHDFRCEGNNAIGKRTAFRGYLGFGSYLGNNCDINAVVGKYCSIGSNVIIVTGTHPTDTFVSTHPCFYSKYTPTGFSYSRTQLYEEQKYAGDHKHAVVIGNDVWIASNVIILAGINIGDGAVVAAGAVVTKDVEPYCIVGGVPAREIRKRFSNEQCNRLKELKWWNKDTNWIVEHFPLFSNVDQFIQKTWEEES